jgi:hypothetical protein
VPPGISGVAVYIEEFERIYPETRNTIVDEAGEIVLCLNRCCVVRGSEVREDLGWNVRITSGSNSIVLSMAGAERLHTSLAQLLDKILLKAS